MAFFFCNSNKVSMSSVFALQMEILNLLYFMAADMDDSCLPSLGGHQITDRGLGGGPPPGGKLLTGRRIRGPPVAEPGVKLEVYL